MMAGEIYLSNLSGQFDYQQILDKYKQLKFQQISLIQEKEDRILQQKSAFKSYVSLLEDFKSGYEKLVDPELFDQKKISVSNEAAVTVSLNNPTAVNPTKLQFNVTRLASNDVWLSRSGVANRNDAVASTDGTLTISVSGNDYAVDYTSTDTIYDVAAKINQTTDEVNASVFFDGSNYRLILSSKNTGTDSAVTLSDSGDLLDNLELGSDYADSHVQVAGNAQIEVYGEVVESQTNTFSNLIQGVDVTVHEVTSEPVTVDIQNDNDAVKKALEDFLSKYNSLIDYEKEQTGQGGALSGDFTLHSVRSSIFNAMTPLMDKLLIRVDHTNGHVSLDSSRFDELIKTDKESLKQAFADVKAQLEPYLDALFEPSGIIDQKEKNYDRKIDRYEETIRATAQRLDREMENLKRQFIHLDGILAQLNDVKTRIAALLPKQNSTQS
jgi:flagellar hook-associated protein 2